jgi:hypothetical protein
MKGNPKAQQFIPLMGYTILHALGEIIEMNNLIINSNPIHNFSQGSNSK